MSWDFSPKSRAGQVLEVLRVHGRPMTKEEIVKISGIPFPSVEIALHRLQFKKKVRVRAKPGDMRVRAYSAI